jgi:hypothetical protein
VLAADSGIYLGVSVGQANLEVYDLAAFVSGSSDLMAEYKHEAACEYSGDRSRNPSEVNWLLHDTLHMETATPVIFTRRIHIIR